MTQLSSDVLSEGTIVSGLSALKEEWMKYVLYNILVPIIYMYCNRLHLIYCVSLSVSVVKLKCCTNFLKWVTWNYHRKTRGKLFLCLVLRKLISFSLSLSLSLSRLTKLLHEILYVGYEDLPILQYWRSALSKEYKTHLMQSART